MRRKILIKMFLPQCHILNQFKSGSPFFLNGVTSRLTLKQTVDAGKADPKKRSSEDGPKDSNESSTNVYKKLKLEIPIHKGAVSVAKGLVEMIEKNGDDRTAKSLLNLLRELLGVHVDCSITVRNTVRILGQKNLIHLVDVDLAGLMFTRASPITMH